VKGGWSEGAKGSEETRERERERERETAVAGSVAESPRA